MKKFIRYLYEYENGRRVRNAGFVKVEEGNSEARAQVYGQGLPPGGGVLGVYVFYLENGQCLGVPMGEIAPADSSFGCRLSYSSRDMGNQERFAHTGGVILQGKSGEKPLCYAALWEENGVRPEEMRVPGPEEEAAREEEAVREEPVPEPEAESVPEMQEPEAEPVPEPETPKTSQAEAEAQVESGPEAETVQPEPQVREPDFVLETAQPEPQAPEPEPEMKAASGETEEEARRENEPLQMYKITRQDLAGLPRREWKLANNQFLLHGFYNYHHLVSFYQEGACWLGVPGIWHPKEQRAAAAFGFGRFVKPEEGNLELNEEEKNDSGQFGYWCRQVSRLLGNGEK